MTETQLDWAPASATHESDQTLRIAASIRSTHITPQGTWTPTVREQLKAGRLTLYTGRNGKEVLAYALVSHGKQELLVLDLGVKTHMQRQGLGKEMLQLFEQLATEAGVVEVRVSPVETRQLPAQLWLSKTGGYTGKTCWGLPPDNQPQQHREYLSFTKKIISGNKKSPSEQEQVKA